MAEAATVRGGGCNRSYYSLRTAHHVDVGAGQVNLVEHGHDLEVTWLGLGVGYDLGVRVRVRVRARSRGHLVGVRVGFGVRVRVRESVTARVRGQGKCELNTLLTFQLTSPLLAYY